MRNAAPPPLTASATTKSLSSEPAGLFVDRRLLPSPFFLYFFLCSFIFFFFFPSFRILSSFNAFANMMVCVFFSPSRFSSLFSKTCLHWSFFFFSPLRHLFFLFGMKSEKDFFFFCFPHFASLLLFFFCFFLPPLFAFTAAHIAADFESVATFSSENFH